MTTTEAPLDGRRQRRDRNRDAVVDALLDLYRAGNLAPRAEEIAESAGISARSLFRYFDDADALVREAIDRQQERLAPLFALTVRPEQPLAWRVNRFVAERAELLDAMGPVGELARSLSPKQPRVASELGRIRAVLRGQLAEVFGPELRQLPAAERSDVLAGLDVASSWEARYLLRQDQRMSSAAAGRVTTRVILGLLAGPA